MEIKFDNEKEYDEFIEWMNDKTPNEFVKERLARHRDMKEVQKAKKILKERNEMNKTFDPIAKYKSEVIKDLVRRFNYSEEEAREEIKDSLFAEMLKRDEDYVMHYSPCRWSEEIYKEKGGRQ